MAEVTGKNFGLLIAYVLPGFFTLAALSGRSAELRAWLGAAPSQAPTVGGFLYVTLASVALGMVVSALRWLILDFIHHRTGLRRPNLDFSALQQTLAAFEGAVENHYRYYQFYGNMLIGAAIALLLPQSFSGLLSTDPSSIRVICVALIVVLFFASRDALRNYYNRTAAVLGLVQRSKGNRT